MKTRVIIRADGGTNTGMGHIVRCLALAHMLKDQFHIGFAIQETSEYVIQTIRETIDSIIILPSADDYSSDADSFLSYLDKNDIVVLDGYHFQTDYQKKIKTYGCRVVAVDDLHAWHQVADVVLNHAGNASRDWYSAEAYTKFCLGYEYVLLRSEFLKLALLPPKSISALKKIFISIGAADVNNITQKFTKALIDVHAVKEIHLLLSELNPNLEELKKYTGQYPKKIFLHFNLTASMLADLLQDCDVSVCPASSISLESCAAGIGLVSGFTADNQLDNLEALIKHKTLVNFGDMNRLTIDEIRERFSALANDPSIFNEMVHNQKKMIDGKSPARILQIFKQSTA